MFSKIRKLCHSLGLKHYIRHKCTTYNCNGAYMRSEYMKEQVMYPSKSLYIFNMINIVV